MKKCFITTIIGERASNLSKLTLPFMEMYAREHGYTLFVLDKLFGHKGAHWVRLECKKYLEENFDLCLYSDIDVAFEPHAPDLINHVIGDNWDIAGARVPMDTYIKDDLKEYIKKARLPEILVDDQKTSYICSGLVIFNKGFLKYFNSKPPLPEIPGINLNDQNAINYAILSGRLTTGLFPVGWGDCPGLFYKEDQAQHFFHFHTKLGESSFTRLKDKIDSFYNSTNGDN
jgi:hypothetical protein